MYAHLMMPLPYFKDDSTTGFVYTKVFASTTITTADQKLIYEDIKYGMNKESLLSIWAAAYTGDATAVAALNNHWFSGVGGGKGFLLPVGALDSIL